LTQDNGPYRCREYSNLCNAVIEVWLADTGWTWLKLPHDGLDRPRRIEAASFDAGRFKMIRYSSSQLHYDPSPRREAAGCYSAAIVGTAM
jgi:hypothetical protein